MADENAGSTGFTILQSIAGGRLATATGGGVRLSVVAVASGAGRAPKSTCQTGGGVERGEHGTIGENVTHCAPTSEDPATMSTTNAIAYMAGLDMLPILRPDVRLGVGGHRGLYP